MVDQGEGIPINACSVAFIREEADERAFETGQYIVKNASLYSVQERSLIMTHWPLLKRTKGLRKIHKQN